jgi:hypothetical protein
MRLITLRDFSVSSKINYFLMGEVGGTQVGVAYPPVVGKLFHGIFKPRFVRFEDLPFLQGIIAILNA